MIITTHILAFPLLVLLWTLDAYAFLLVARMILSRIGSMHTNRIAMLLQEFTDPLLCGVQRQLTSWRGRAVPSWAPWLTLMAMILLVRHLLIWALLSFAGTPGGSS